MPIDSLVLRVSQRLLARMATTIWHCWVPALLLGNSEVMVVGAKHWVWGGSDHAVERVIVLVLVIAALLFMLLMYIHCARVVLSLMDHSAEQLLRVRWS